MKSLFCLGQFLVVSLILLAPNYSDGYALVRFKLVTLLDVTGRLSSVSQSVSQAVSHVKFGDLSSYQSVFQICLPQYLVLIVLLYSDLSRWSLTHIPTYQSRTSGASSAWQTRGCWWGWAREESLETEVSDTSESVEGEGGVQVWWWGSARGGAGPGLTTTHSRSIDTNERESPWTAS